MQSRRASKPNNEDMRELIAATPSCRRGKQRAGRRGRRVFLMGWGWVSESGKVLRIRRRSPILGWNLLSLGKGVGGSKLFGEKRQTG